DGVSVTTHPLAGLDPGETIEAVAVADTMRRALAASRWGGLGPKGSVVVAGGGALHLDALPADIRPSARAPPAQVPPHAAPAARAAQTDHTLGSRTTHTPLGWAQILRRGVAAPGSARPSPLCPPHGGGVFFPRGVPQPFLPAPAPAASAADRADPHARAARRA